MIRLCFNLIDGIVLYNKSNSFITLFRISNKMFVLTVNNYNLRGLRLSNLVIMTVIAKS